MLENVFINAAGFSHRCFPVNFVKLLRTLFDRTAHVAASEIILEYCNHHRDDSPIIL